MIKATIIADSITKAGDRLTTYVLTFPRIVLAEFNTHRVLSRNSASSRAIPFETMVRMVQENPFIPIAWQKDHKGMQGTEYLSDHGTISEVTMARSTWLTARDWAIKSAESLHSDKNGFSSVTKQLCNRLLEPFLWHTVIVTASEWENFFALRANKDAEIHIAELAHKMLDAYNESTPKFLNYGEWHIPFGENLDMQRTKDWTDEQAADWMIKVATARCARVSYLNFEGKDDYLADIKLYDRLLKAGHMSPFEHCARVMTEMERLMYARRTYVAGKGDYEYGWVGNFRGFIQLRKMLENENKTDDRVIKYDKSSLSL